MKIALLFDGASALGASPDVLILETVEEIEHILATEGNHVVRIPVHGDGRWIERIRRGKFDLAFNLCEGIDGVATLEPAVIAALELLEVPYTGASSWTAALCLRKHLVNGLLERSGIPIPRFLVARRAAHGALGRLPSVGYPAICKPAAEDASLGVEQRSVVRTARALAERVAAMHERWDEVLVQRFIDGREVNVGILGDETLPIAEIAFNMPKGMWRIVSYRSKWETGSDEDIGALPGRDRAGARGGAEAHRPRRVARRRRRERGVRARGLPHRPRRPPVGARGERQPRHRARRRARAHGA